jgi:hypothetical protein
MATNNRSARGSKPAARPRNNNPEGRNQYSGAMGAARSNPLAAAAVVGGAIAGSLFLWARRNQISDQIGSLADQIDEWREGMTAGSDVGADGVPAASTAGRTRRVQKVDGGRSQVEIAEEALTLKELGATA